MSRRGVHAAPAGDAGDAGAEARRAEREETRRVTRELHEMLQAAGDTVRALRNAQKGAEEWADALRDEVHAAIRDSVHKTVDKRCEELNAHFNEGARTLAKQINELRLAVAASGDPEAAKDAIRETVKRSLIHPDFLEALAVKLGTWIRGEETDSDILVRMAKPGEQPGFYEGYRP